MDFAQRAQVRPLACRLALLICENEIFDHRIIPMARLNILVMMVEVRACY